MNNKDKNRDNTFNICYISVKISLMRMVSSKRIEAEECKLS